jgi:hypothetical protein
MTKIVSAFSFSAAILGLLIHAGAAGATSPTLARTWVSGTSAGSDSNPCTRALPCATFLKAYNTTIPGGEIDVLDGGEFGHVTIAHSITIANDGTGTAAITPISAGNGIDIDAGASDAVVLRGLSLNGVSASSSIGISFSGGGSLLVDHCKIQGFGFTEILFTPLHTNGKLEMKDTVLSNDGGGAASLWIQPTNGFTATVELERVQILNSIGNGIRADANFDGVDVELHDVTVDGAGASGIVAVSQTSGGPAVNVVADDVTSAHNNGFGVRAVGGTASIALSRSTVTNNVRGIGASSGGALVSYGDNRIKDNTNGDGDPTSTLPLK